MERMVQIARAAVKAAEKRIELDPIVGLTHVVLWKDGAEWADKNPKKGYASKREWQEAGKAHCEESFKSLTSKFKGDVDLKLDVLLTLTFLEGMDWADENPAQMNEAMTGDEFDFDYLWWRSAASRACFFKPEIPPHGRDIMDVDYVDIHDVGITDTARILTEHSMTPYSVEERRRENMANGIVSMIEGIDRRLTEFERKDLHMAIGVGKCAYKWENDLTDEIWAAFDEMAEEVRDALSKFKKRAVKGSWDLWSALGYDDEGYAQYLKEEEEEIRQLGMRNDFLYDVMHVGGFSCALDDDLPF